MSINRELRYGDVVEDSRDGQMLMIVVPPVDAHSSARSIILRDIDGEPAVDPAYSDSENLYPMPVLASGTWSLVNDN